MKIIFDMINWFRKIKNKKQSKIVEDAMAIANSSISQKEKMEKYADLNYCFASRTIGQRGLYPSVDIFYEICCLVSLVPECRYACIQSIEKEDYEYFSTYAKKNEGRYIGESRAQLRKERINT